MGPKPIRTNNDFLRQFARGAIASIPKANSEHPVGELLNHVKDSALADLDDDEEEKPPEDGVLDVEGEEVR